MSAFKANPHSGYQPEWRIDGSTMQSKTVKNKKKGAQKQQDRKSSQKKKKKKRGGGNNRQPEKEVGSYYEIICKLQAAS